MLALQLLIVTLVALAAGVMHDANHGSFLEVPQHQQGGPRSDRFLVYATGRAVPTEPVLRSHSTHVTS